MEFPKKSRSCKSHRNAPANNCPECSELNKEICRLCRKQLFFGFLSDNIVIEGGGLLDVCQCFSGGDDMMQQEMHMDAYERKYQLLKSANHRKNIKVKDNSLLKESSVYRAEEYRPVSSGESEIPQASSNDYISSLGELSSVQNLADNSNTASPSSGKSSNKSKIVNSCSSGYPLSLSEQSNSILNDNRNITSQNSGEDSMNTSYAERESSFDETGSKNYSDFKISDKSSYSGSPQSDQKLINPKLPMRENETNSSTNENKRDVSAEIEKFVFNNPDIKISKVRPVLPRPFPIPPIQPYSQFHSPAITSPSSSMQIPRPPIQHYSQPYSQFNSPTIASPTSSMQIPRPPFQPYSQFHPPTIASPTSSMQISRPPFQPYSQFHPPTITKPSSSMQMPSHPHIHPQLDPHLQSYNNTIMNKPVIQTNFLGRFPVSARPQFTPSYQSQQHDGSNVLSKKLLAQAQTQQVDSEQNCTKKERIKDWLDEMERLPPELQPTNSGWACGWSIASNEENEGIPPTFSGTSTDERSSTEISEEENRRQRSLRRPPRHFRGKTK